MSENKVYLLASTVQQAWAENRQLIPSEHLQLLGRFLNLPHASTQAPLWQACPQLQALEHHLVEQVPAGLIDQWHVHQQRLNNTWQRLQNSSFDVHITNPHSPAMAYLKVAGMGPRWWQRSALHLPKVLGTYLDAFTCLYDLLCIFACDEHGTRYWDSFGMPCAESQAIDYPIHISCADFLASDDNG